MHFIRTTRMVLGVLSGPVLVRDQSCKMHATSDVASNFRIFRGSPRARSARVPPFPSLLFRVAEVVSCFQINFVCQRNDWAGLPQPQWIPIYLQLAAVCLLTDRVACEPLCPVAHFSCSTLCKAA